MGRWSHENREQVLKEGPDAAGMIRVRLLKLISEHLPAKLVRKVRPAMAEEASKEIGQGGLL